jgi:hypothetical protein
MSSLHLTRRQAIQFAGLGLHVGCRLPARLSNMIVEKDGRGRKRGSRMSSRAVVVKESAKEVTKR